MLLTPVGPTSEHSGQQFLPGATFAGSSCCGNWLCWHLEWLEVAPTQRLRSGIPESQRPSVDYRRGPPNSAPESCSQPHSVWK